ncbi:MAG: hypothetical protein EPN93_05385 [Spirochaetes bacterium]|nr:MAG: hypothetical protein EPN93_05385 [Spirochaetota bacterium]
MKKLAICSIALAVMLVSCGGGTQYRKASEDKGSGQWGPKEVKATVSKMVGSMVKFVKDEWQQPAFIQVKSFKNKTSEHIDTAMITNEITTNLIKKRIKFVDDNLTKDAIEQMEKNMTGMFEDSGVTPGQLKSPNLYLTGDIRDNVRNVDGKRLQYLVVTMQLYNLATQVIEWQDQKEFLKATSKDKISF